MTSPWATAEQLAQTLSSLAQGGAAKRTGANVPGGAYTPPAAPGAPGMPAAPAAPAAPAGPTTAEILSGEVKVTADKAQNALIIQASGSDFSAIQRIIEKLDRPRRQVFVEAVIMEVNLRDETQFGVGMHKLQPVSYKGDTAFIPFASEPGATGLTSFNLSSIVSLGGFLTGFAGPVSTELSKLGLNIPSLGVLVQALQSSSDVNVLSTPHLLASDNEESEITVGQNVPFQAGYAPSSLSSLLGSTGTTSTASTSALGSALGLGGLSSLYAPIQRQNVELRLKLKPQISEGDNVRLTIEEQTEEIASNDAVLGPTTAKRSVKTQIVARDQSTIVIGGLIQERAVKSVKKVPLLGSLPLFGWLFRSTDTTKTKTNLLLFLTPYVIRDERDYQRLYEKKRAEQQQFIEEFYGKRAGYEVEIDFARKSGPYPKLRRDVREETLKIENGGPGLPSERVTTPGGTVAPPAPPVERRRPRDFTEEEGEVERLEVQPEVPAPGTAKPPTPPEGTPAPAPQGTPTPAPQGTPTPAPQGTSTPEGSPPAPEGPAPAPPAPPQGR